MKLYIVGYAQHGKDTVAGIITELTGLTAESSSWAACKKVIYPKLKSKYKTIKECFEDRVNHRKLWYDMIVEYNKDNKTRLAEEIFSESDIYIGIRAKDQLEETLHMVDLVIAVYDPRKEIETGSMDFDPFDYADVIIWNHKDLNHLKEKVKNLCSLLR